MELHLQKGGQRRRVQATHRGETLELNGEGLDAIQARILARDRSTLLLEIDGRRHRVRYARAGSQLHLHLHGHVVRVRLLDDEAEERDSGALASPRVLAPMPGRVLEVLVTEGDRVRAGQALVRVEAMKMEVDLEAALDGVVKAVHVRAGEFVEPEQVVVTLDPSSRES